MIITALMRILKLVTRPGVLAAIFGLLLVAWLCRGGQLLEDNSFTAKATQYRQDLMDANPEAAAILTQIDDQRQQHALLVASYSAGEDGRRRSILADMAAEVAATETLPYRARIAALALDQVDLRNPEMREAFLVSHSTACENLAISGDWRSVSDYVSLLEQAAQEPNVWPLVRDDPLALVFWSQLEQHELSLLSFYHRNRDWLADHLAILDWSAADSEWSVQIALTKLAEHESALKTAVEQGELGVYALAVMLTHGSLVELCLSQHALDPCEVISVIVLNQDILGEREGDSRWIGEKASWLVPFPVIGFRAGRRVP